MDSDDEFNVVEEVRKVFSKTAVSTVYALIENITRLGDEDDVQTATQKICNFLLETGDLYDTQENDLAENKPKRVETVKTYVADSVQTNSRILPKIEQPATASSQPKNAMEVKITELQASPNENKDPNTLSTDKTTFECACCFDDTAFITMVQCSEGHLFCSKCLERYTQEVVYGQGKCTLICMSADCGVSFPKSQLSQALPADLYKKYEERISLESINSAGLENFVRCKFCNYGAELDSDAKYFSCTQCGKIFCRKCQELYDDHQGLSCKEIEKNGEKDIRKSYEERMTEAKIRTCSNCKSRFTKGSGCNKISCRCLTTMCYLCRKPNVKYDHFCQHERLNSQKCNSCDRPCYLWSNADEDDQMAIEELRKQANDARVQEGFTLERVIGAPNLPISSAQAQAQFEDNFTDDSDEYDENYSDDEQENNDVEESENDEWDPPAPIVVLPPPPVVEPEANEDEWYEVLNNYPVNAPEDMSEDDDDSSNYADVEDYLADGPAEYDYHDVEAQRFDSEGEGGDFPGENFMDGDVEDYASEDILGGDVEDYASEDILGGDVEDYASEDILGGDVEDYDSEEDHVAGDVENNATEEDHVAGNVEDYATEEDHVAGNVEDYATEEDHMAGDVEDYGAAVVEFFTNEDDNDYDDYNYHDDYQYHVHDHMADQYDDYEDSNDY